ncbi:glycosyltransferase family 39 protein [Azonexus hydrophilus]|uniref:glycosyltransferase family 39 protein n=1 Tax=Azonexus hydrophilus TaxID=418702 RepID=UPI00249099D1|nr:glycosyltransferase family 39 protein [Azonexus hydrophilus]
MIPGSPCRRFPARKEFFLSLPGVMIAVAIYTFVHGTTRLIASKNLGEDDPLDNLLVQTLANGYTTEHGPLYNWLLWLLQQVMGPGPASFLVLKYSLLTGVAAFIFLITRRLTGSPWWAFIAVESLAAVYQTFWRLHEGFTHRVGTMFLIMATLWAAIQLAEHGRWRDTILFSLLIGLGLLSEHWFIAFFVALLLAGSLQPRIRERLFSARLLACLPLTLLIASPYLLWLSGEPQRLNELVAAYRPDLASHSPAGMLAGARDALLLPILVLAPWIFIVPATFPGVWRGLWQAPSPADGGANLLRWLRDMLVLQLFGLVLIKGLLFAHSNYAVHGLLPMFLPTVIWLTAKISESQPSPRRIKAFMIILLAFTATAYGMRAGNLFVQEPFCSRCRWGIPYAELANDIRARGFSDGLLITNSVHTGGNLRPYFPQARIEIAGQSTGSIPTGQSLAIVWTTNNGKLDGEKELQQLLTEYRITKQPDIKHFPWQHHWREPGYRDAAWGIVLAPPAATEFDTH